MVEQLISPVSFVRWMRDTVSGFCTRRMGALCRQDGAGNLVEKSSCAGWCWPCRMRELVALSCWLKMADQELGHGGSMSINVSADTKGQGPRRGVYIYVSGYRFS